MPKLDASQLPDLQSAITALPTRSTLSTFEAVFALRESIVDALERGQTLGAIVKVLEQKVGIKIQPSTLRWHLWRARKHGLAERPVRTSDARAAAPARSVESAGNADRVDAVDARSEARPTTSQPSSDSPARRAAPVPTATSNVPRGHFQPEPDSDDI